MPRTAKTPEADRLGVHKSKEGPDGRHHAPRKARLGGFGQLKENILQIGALG